MSIWEPHASSTLPGVPRRSRDTPQLSHRAHHNRNEPLSESPRCVRHWWAGLHPLTSRAWREDSCDVRLRRDVRLPDRPGRVVDTTHIAKSRAGGVSIDDHFATARGGNSMPCGTCPCGSPHPRATVLSEGPFVCGGWVRASIGIVSDEDNASYVCSICGASTGRVENWKAISPVLTHTWPGTLNRCRASGRRASIVGQHRIVECPSCRRRVRVDSTSGRTEQHLDSRGFGLCDVTTLEIQPASLRVVGEGAKQGPVWSPDYTEKDNFTWHASGGLPTHGKGQ